jgi:hypothetical protein
MVLRVGQNGVCNAILAFILATRLKGVTGDTSCQHSGCLALVSSAHLSISAAVHGHPKRIPAADAAALHLPSAEYGNQLHIQGRLTLAARTSLS